MSSSQIPTRRGATAPRHRLQQAQSLLLSGPSSTSSSSRRRRSRSPESRIVSAHTNTSQATEPTSNANRKKKGRSQLEGFFPAIWPSSSSTLVEDSTDRGRKGKSKSKTLPRLPSENEVGDHHRSNHAKVKKDRSRSRDSTYRRGGAGTKSSASPADLSEDETDAASRTSVAGYTGPLASAEFVRLKNENESLKKQLKQATKTINKQNKTIEELRQQVTDATKSKKEQGQQLEKLKSKSKKSDDLLTTIEGNLNCQICMESLLKPFALTPCGHIYCQSCLQNWFRTAPVNEDDMVDDDDPEYILFRRKSCPSCRTLVQTRPVPLFLIKSIASSLIKSKLPPGQSNRASPAPSDSDPWDGIFPVPGADDDDDDDDDDGIGFGDSDGEDEDGEDLWYDGEYGTDPDDDPYEGEYVLPRWEPPSVSVSSRDYDPADLALIRRGATVDMIDRYQMRYSHDDGISAVLPPVDDDGWGGASDGVLVYLGWNIRLKEDDESGCGYMDWIRDDIWEREERWDVTEYDVRRQARGRGAIEGVGWIAWRFVPEDEVDDYASTDTEGWVDEEDEEDDD
ncbi:hypothetical protein JAAARDRAFT_81781 [Jaapia argillacea MUCL 33604]|uniref:RING-type domain-containing protein n=1 Tax=Jaapia argillacea MUCL 33604 TaxID=933084 RepID=A0A067PA71_9AGAM|nr:hypothetical protein JAAARDRAFT_81781 [Jaapia argillacea MUCL 33604]